MDQSAPVEAVMFDMDGTLVDSRTALVRSYHDASTQVLGEARPTDEVELEAILKLRAIDAVPQITGGDPELTERFAAAFQTAYAHHQQNIEAFPGVARALQRLADMGVALGIATSKARARLELDLDRVGIGHFFAFTVTGDEVPHAKPAPDPVLAAIEGLGANPERSLYVGDGENDILAAHAAGVRAVGVSFGFHPEDCRAAGPDHWIDSYDELVELVASLPARAA
jgi:HAD superfamily hydrolase (TIGR01509 family)